MRALPRTMPIVAHAWRVCLGVRARGAVLPTSGERAGPCGCTRCRKSWPVI